MKELEKLTIKICLRNIEEIRENFSSLRKSMSDEDFSEKKSEIHMQLSDIKDFLRAVISET